MAEKIQIAIDYVQSHPEEAARILEEQGVGEAAAFLEQIAGAQSARVLGHMLPAPAARCVQEMSADVAANTLTHLHPVAIAPIFRCLNEETRESLLQRMPKRIGFMCAVILNYARTVVGAWMDPLALAVPITCSTAEARKRVRDDPYDGYRAIYVVNESHVLQGIVSLDALISADDDTPISKLIKPVEFSLPDRSRITSFVEHAGWKDNDDLPVIDREQKFLGVIRHADLRRALMEITPGNTTPAASNTLMGFVEGSFLGLTDIVNGTLSAARAVELNSTKESSHDR